MKWSLLCILLVQFLAIGNPILAQSSPAFSNTRANLLQALFLVSCHPLPDVIKFTTGWRSLVGGAGGLGAGSGQGRSAGAPVPHRFGGVSFRRHGWPHVG